MEQIAKTTPSFSLVLDGFSAFWGTFVFWDAAKDPLLTALHRRLPDALNPLREGKLLPIHEQLLKDETVPAGLRDSIRKYGNPLCGEEERPHLTLTRLKDAAQAEVARAFLQNFQPTNAWLSVRSLCIGAVGPHGTCPMLYRVFPLAG